METLYAEQHGDNDWCPSTPSRSQSPSSDVNLRVSALDWDCSAQTEDDAVASSLEAFNLSVGHQAARESFIYAAAETSSLHQSAVEDSRSHATPTQKSIADSFRELAAGELTSLRVSPRVASSPVDLFSQSASFDVDSRARSIRNSLSSTPGTAARATEGDSSGGKLGPATGYRHPAPLLQAAADSGALAEVQAECTYVRHHKQKIALVLSAMRQFSAGLAARGPGRRQARFG